MSTKWPRSSYATTTIKTATPTTKSDTETISQTTPQTVAKTPTATPSTELSYSVSETRHSVATSAVIFDKDSSDDDQEQNLIELLAAMPLTEKVALGFSVDDLILDCKFEGTQCYLKYDFICCSKLL